MFPLHLANIRKNNSSNINRGSELLIWLATTLISGLVIIVSISPGYLSELNPFTLLLLSVACSLPIWAINQALWWYIGKSITKGIVQKLVFIIDVSDEHRKEFTFALSQLLSLVKIIHFIPHEKIANLVTVIVIYLSAAIFYFTSSSPATLYINIILISLVVWFVSLILLRRAYRKIDAQPLRDLWRQIKSEDELLSSINRHFKRLEEILLSLRLNPGKREN
jgi:hypothetical protein